MSITLDGSNATTTGVINPGTAVATTSGTSIDFTGIPAGVKRITVIFNGVSTSGTSVVQIQIGSGSFLTSGYLGVGCGAGNGGTVGVANNSSGFLTSNGGVATYVRHGITALCNISGNTWASQTTLGLSDSAVGQWGAGSVSLSGVIDRVRLTTVNGTDTFDAGSVNIFWE